MPDRKLVPDVIGDQDLVALPPGANVRQAAIRMAERRIGAVLVMEGKTLKGIFTERDLTVRVVASGRNPDVTSLGEVMTANPDTLPPDAPAMAALHLMETRNYRHLPVVRAGQVIGVVSVRDLFSVSRRQLEQELQEREDFIFGSSYSSSAAAD